MTRQLDSLMPTEIREAVLAQMLDEGRWAEAYHLHGSVAKRLGSHWGGSGLPVPGPYGGRRQQEVILNRYHGRVARALEALAASGDLIRAGKDQPGPDGTVWSGVQYWVPAAYEKAKSEAAAAAAVKGEEKLRWDLVASRLDAVEVSLNKNGSLSLEDWEHLLEATGL